MTDPRAPELPARASDGLDRAQALALLLPALAVAWPGPLALVARDPIATELTAAGLAALACVPAAWLFAWRCFVERRFAPGRSALLALLLAVALLSSAANEGGDPLERARALLALGSALVLALSGAQLGAAGRRAFVRGAIVLALVLLVPALADRAGGFGGVLQNSGELSNAALPGALAGAACFASERLAWRRIGLAALALFLIHAFAAPVLAGLVALGSAAAVAWLARWNRSEAHGSATRLLVAAAACALGLAWNAAGRPLFRPTAPSGAVPAKASNELGGVEVRRRVALASLALAADSPIRGVGAGQFAVAFPPYRDPRELELSSPGRGTGIETEVEHPHDDHLLFLVEEGVPGALIWAAFALCVIAASMRKLRNGTSEELALATASLGVLVAAFANATLSSNAAASSLAFACFGATLGPGARAWPRSATRICGALVALAFVAFAAPPAARLVRHGLALVALPDGAVPSPTALRRAVDDALAAEPASPIAWTLRARQLEATAAPAREIEDAWRHVLAVRPHRFEALVQLGVQHAIAGEVDEARALFDAAAQLDPAHPGLAKNRVRLELVSGDAERGAVLLEELNARGGADALWLRDLGAELLCRGLDREARRPLALADPRFAELDAAEAMQIARQFRASGSALAADGFDVEANRSWAREHAADGRWDDARRMLRQAIRISRDTVPGGAPRIRMELAAAMWRSDQRDEARDELAGLVFRTEDWDAVEDWTRAALREMGYGPPS